MVYCVWQPFSRYTIIEANSGKITIFCGGTPVWHPVRRPR